MQKFTFRPPDDSFRPADSAVPRRGPCRRAAPSPSFFIHVPPAEIFHAVRPCVKLLRPHAQIDDLHDVRARESEFVRRDGEKGGIPLAVVPAAEHRVGRRTFPEIFGAVAASNRNCRRRAAARRTARLPAPGTRRRAPCPARERRPKTASFPPSCSPPLIPRAAFSSKTVPYRSARRRRLPRASPCRAPCRRRRPLRAPDR